MGTANEFGQLRVREESETEADHQLVNELITPDGGVKYDGAGGARLIFGGSTSEQFVSDFSDLNDAITDIGSTPTSLVINEATTLATDATIPATLTLRFIGEGVITITTGEVLTILGYIDAGPYQIFDNVLSGEGTVSFQGNKLIDKYQGAWWGMVGDGTGGASPTGTDNTPILQRIIDTLYDQEVEATLVLPKGEILIAGPLVDTSFSNSQIVLPKAIEADGQYSFTWQGQGDPSNLGIGEVSAGTILRSTLTSGSGGSMISVKTTSAAHNRSILNATFRDLTLRMPINPTHTALDLRYVMQPRGFNLRIGTGEEFDETTTEPSTSSSAGLKMPIAYVPSTTYFENIVVTSFYTGVVADELTRIENLTVTHCVRAVAPQPTVHQMYLHHCLFVNNKHCIFFDGPTESWVDIDMDVERATTANYTSGEWFIGVDEISDTTNSGRGRILYQLDLPFGLISNHAIAVDGAANLVITPFEQRVFARVYHNTTQSIPDATVTNLAFNSERCDTGVMHDTSTNNSRLTCRIPGVYTITANVSFPNAAGDGRAIFLRLNNTTVIAANNMIPLAGGFATRLFVSTTYQLAKNDYVEVQVFQDSGDVLDVEFVDTFTPDFMMVKIA